jgi:hypothetical protein
MPDYTNGKIYAIRSHQTEEIYIGSSVQTLCVRLAGHRRDYKHYLKEGKKYVSSFEMLKHDDAYIELIENHPCLCREELHRKEGELIRNTPNCVNKCIAGRTKQEYDYEHKDEKKQYYEDNRDTIAQQQKQYYIDNKQQKKQYYIDNRDDNKKYRKQFYNEHKNTILQKQRLYYEQHKDKINQRRRQQREDKKKQAIVS